METKEQGENVISILDFERIMQQIKETEEKYSNPIVNLQYLKKKILSAQKLRPWEIPPNIITMGSVVEIKTDDDDFTFNLNLVYPEFENVRENKISVFSNLGTAIFLQKTNDIITYYTWKKEHIIKVLNIQYQPEAIGNFSV